MRIEPNWVKEVEKESGIKVSACFQCKKCTAGCPLTFAMDIFPDRIIRLVQLGQKDPVLSSSTIWTCSGCETCTTRCPNEVDVAGTMDYLKEKSIAGNIAVQQAETLVFHQSFLEEIWKRGRIFELGLMKNYMQDSGELKKKMEDKTLGEDLSLAWAMFKKGRMPLLPKSIKSKGEIREILKKKKL